MINSFFSIFIKVLIAIPVVMTTWLVSFFAMNNSFLVSTGYAIVGGAIASLAVSFSVNLRFLKKHQLTRKEYQYIKKNLKEAKPKLYRLQKSLLSIRHLPSLKQRIDFMRVVRKIYKLTAKEPKRFYQAEQFYFSHLDSALELAEKYVFLSAQPKKNRELDVALYETRQTLEELIKTVEKDLYHVLSNDIEQLQFEIDVAKHTINKTKDSQLHDESRRL